MRSVEETFSGRVPLIAGAFGGVVLLAILITVLVGLARGAGRPSEEQSFEYRHHFQRRPISVEHMVLPQALPNELMVPLLFREPRQAWSTEDIAPFLLDTRSLGLEYLRRENLEQLSRMLEAVP